MRISTAGRCELYVPEELFKEFKKKGVPADQTYVLGEDGESYVPKLEENQFVILKADQSAKKTQLGRVVNGMIRKLEFRKSAPYGISPRNAGQYFLQEALMQPAEKAPLVIVKGMAGTSKTFYFSCGRAGETSEPSDRGVSADSDLPSECSV